MDIGSYALSMHLAIKTRTECGPMRNVMAALPNIGGALCSTPQSLTDAHYYTVSENVPPLTCYSLDIPDPITIIFGRRFTKKVRNQTMLCFPTSVDLNSNL